MPASEVMSDALATRRTITVGSLGVSAPEWFHQEKNDVKTAITTAPAQPQVFMGLLLVQPNATSCGAVNRRCDR